MPVAIYARISSDRSKEASQTSRQIDLCHLEAERLGVTIYENHDPALGGYRGAFHDEVSAYSGKRRPAWDEVERLALTGQIDGILAYAQDRIHRRAVEMLSFIGAVNNAGHGLMLHFVRGTDLDFRSAQGRLVAGVLSVFAGAEVEQLTQRVVDEKAESAEAGRWHGGRPPLGYHLVPDDNGKLALKKHPVTAPAISRVVAGYLEGKSLTTLLQDFREQTGLKTGYASLKYSLITPSIAGQRMHLPVAKRKGRSVHELYTTPYVLEHEAEFYPAQWEPIISLQQWRLLRDKLVNGADRKRGKRPSKSLLAGLVYCASCGGRMGYDGTAFNRPGDPESGVKRYGTYRCARSNGGCGRMQIGGRLLEPFIETEALKVLSRAVSGKNYESLKMNADRVVALETEMQRVEDSLVDLYNDFKEGQSMRQRVYERLRSEREHRLTELENELTQLRVTGAAESQLLAATELYATYDVNQRRAILQQVITRIEVRSIPQAAGARNILQARRLSVTWSIDDRKVVTYGATNHRGEAVLTARKPHDWDG